MADLLEIITLQQNDFTGIFLNDEKILETALINVENIMEIRYLFDSIDTQEGLLSIYNMLDVAFEIPLDENLLWLGIEEPFIITDTHSQKKIAIINVENENLATLTFTGEFWDELEEEDLINLDLEDMYVELQVKLAPSIEELKQEEVTVFLLNGENAILYIAEFQKKDHEITKDVEMGGYQYKWNILYNPGAVLTQYPITIKDTWNNNEHIIIPDSIQIKRGEMDLTEEIGAISHTTSASVIEVILNEYIPDILTITYETRLSDQMMQVQNSSQMNISNRVELLDNDNLSLIEEDITAELTIPSGNRLMSQKSGSQSGRRINWTIDFNLMDRVITGETFFITDVIPKGLIFNYDARVINKIDSSAVDFVANFSGNTLELEIDATSTATSYRILFSTTIEDDYFDQSLASSTFTNLADITFEWEKYDIDGSLLPATTVVQKPSYSVVYECRVLRKSGTSYNPATGELTWTINVNPYNIDILNGNIVDDLSLSSSYPMHYVVGSFTSTTANIDLLSVSNDNKILTFSVGNIGTKQESLTFKTLLENPEDYAGNILNSNGIPTTKTYQNTSVFSGEIIIEEFEGEEPEIFEIVSSSYTGSGQIRSQMIKKDAIGYDIVTQTATWQVQINQNNMIMTDVEITDTFSNGQTLILDSVLVDANEPDENTEISFDTLTMLISIPNLTQQTVITYQTKINPDEIATFKDDKTIHLLNAAKLVHTEGPTTGITVTSEILIENELINKTAYYNTETRAITYIVKLNKHQLILEDIILTDTISDGLQLDINSIYLYEGIITSFGDLTKGDLIFDFENPRFSYSMNAFNLDLHSLTGPMILEFECYVTSSQKSTFENTVYLLSDNLSSELNSSTVSISVGSGGSGTSSKRVNLKLTKSDLLRPNIVIPNAEFIIKQVVGSSLIDLMTRATDELGTAEFYPLKGSLMGTPVYVLEEVTGVSGYNPIILSMESSTDITVLPDNTLEKNCIKFYLNAESYEVDNTIYNQPVMGSIDFVKLSDKTEKNNWLPVVTGAAEFIFTDKTLSSTYTKTAITDELGVIELDLPFGSYSVSETLTPTLHTKTEDFSLTISPTGLVEPMVSAVYNVYFRPSFHLKKVSSTGVGLSSINFNLLEEFDSEKIIVETGFTNSLGELSFEDLYGGSHYFLQEVTRAGYYLQDDYEIGVVLQAEDYDLFTWKNFEFDAKLKVTIVDMMRTGVVLSGGVFELYDEFPDDEEILPIKTVTSILGICLFDNLWLTQTSFEIGVEPNLATSTYWLKQVSATDGYYISPLIHEVNLNPIEAGINNPRTFTYSAVIENEPIKHSDVSFTFKKITTKNGPYILDSDASLQTPLPGAQFKIIDLTVGSDYVLSASSDSQGDVYFEDIPFGTYNLVEVSTPAFHHPFEIHTVSFDESGKLVSVDGIEVEEDDDFFFVNNIFTPQLIITVTKSDGLTPMSSLTFELLKDDESSFTPQILAITNEFGVAVFDDLIGGDSYIVKLLNQPISGFYLTPNYTIPVVNQDSNLTFHWVMYEHDASISLKKFDGRDGIVPVAGAVFELYNVDPDVETSSLPILTATSIIDIPTNISMVEFENLALIESVPLNFNEPVLSTTKYWIKETDAPVGYSFSDEVFDLDLTGGSSREIRTQNYVIDRIDNFPVVCDISFKKLSSKDSDIILGAKFLLTDLTTGSAYVQTAVVDSSGMVEFVDVPFGRHLISEVVTPDYHYKTSSFEIEIDNLGNLIDFNGLTGSLLDIAVDDLTVVNEIKKTSLSLLLVDDIGELISGVEFELYYMKNGTSPQLLTSFETVLGEATTGNILMGGEVYKLVQKTQTEDYYLSSDEFFTISDTAEGRTNPSTTLQPITHKWIKYRHDATIKLQKFDARAGKIYLTDVAFTLFGSKYDEDENIDVIDEDNLIATLETGELGILEFKNLNLEQAAPTTTNTEPTLLATTYFIKERWIPIDESYSPNTTIYKAVLSSGIGQSTRTQVFDIGRIDNEAISADFTFTKYTNRDVGQILEGAEFLLTDETEIDETYYSTFSQIRTSNASGIATFNNIPFGTHTIVETVVPDYHEPLSFEITIDKTGKLTLFDNESVKYDEFDNLITELEITNKIKLTNATVTIKNDLGDLLDDLEFTLYREINDELDTIYIPVTTIITSSGVAYFENVLMGGEVYQIVLESDISDKYYATGKLRIPVEQLGPKNNPEENLEPYFIEWTLYSYAATISLTKYDARPGLVTIDDVEFVVHPAKIVGENLIPDESVSYGPFTTVAGSIAFNNLPLNQGTISSINTEPMLEETVYFIKELSVPPARGYIFEDILEEVTLSSGNNSATRKQVFDVARIDNTPAVCSFSFEKFTDKEESLTNIFGAEFKIIDQTTYSSFTQTANVDKFGVVTFTDIPFGLHIITETIVPAYHEALSFEVLINEDGDLVEFNGLSASEIAELKSLIPVVNHIKRTELTLSLVDASNTPISNVSFKIIRVIDSGEDIEFAEVFTDEYGVIIFDNLIGGESYRIEMINNPISGYYQSGSYSFSVTSFNSLDSHLPISKQRLAKLSHTWIVYPYNASLTLTKYDSRAGFVLVENVVFELYKDSEEFDEITPYLGQITTDEFGQGTFENLALIQGEIMDTTSEPRLEDTTFWLVEKIVPEGYDILEAQKVTLKAINGRTFETTINVYNVPHKGDFAFTKFTNRDNLPLEGATFTLIDLTDNSMHSQSSSDVNGLVSFENVPFGKYDLFETEVPHYHEPFSTTLEMSREGLLIEFDGLDSETIPAGNLEIQNVVKTTSLKINKFDDKLVPMDGVVFELYHVQESEFGKISRLVGTSSTAVGMADFDGLMGGEEYVVKELDNPLTGFYVSGELRFVVTDYDVVAGVDEAYWDLSEIVYDWINFAYNTQLTIQITDTLRPVIALVGADFELYQDDSSGFGPLPGLPYQVATTDSSGKLIFTQLQLNQNDSNLSINEEPLLSDTIYWLVQTSAPDGYLFDSTPLKIILEVQRARDNNMQPRVYNFELDLTNAPQLVEDSQLIFTKFSNKESDYTLGKRPLSGVNFTLMEIYSMSELILNATSDELGIVIFENVPFGRYWLMEDNVALYHQELDGFEVEIDTSGNCVLFNGITNPNGNDFEIVNEILTSELIITKLKKDADVAFSNVSFELLTSAGITLNKIATTNEYGVTSFTDLLAGSVYKVREIGTPLAGFYQTGELTQFIGSDSEYYVTWYNYEFDGAISAIVQDKFSEVGLANTNVGLYASNEMGNHAKGPKIMMATTDTFGEVLFDGLGFKQDLSVLTIDEEPVLLDTTYWLIEENQATGYYMNGIPKRVNFLNPNRHSSEIEFLYNESMAAPILSLISHSKRVESKEVVLFDEIVDANGKIIYDFSTGIIHLNCDGLYYVTWNVAPQTTLATDKLNFSIFADDKPIIGSANFITDHVRGFALIEAKVPGVEIELINVSDSAISLSRKTFVTSSLTIMKISEINPVKKTDFGRLFLEVGYEKNVFGSDIIVFENILLPTTNPSLIDYDIDTGEIEISPGVYLVKWDFPILGTDALPHVTVKLQSTQIEQTWNSYIPLPLGTLSGSAIIVNYLPKEQLKFVVDEDIVELLIGAHSNVTITQVHDILQPKGCVI